MTDEKKIQELEEAFKEEVVEVVPAPKPEVKRPPNAWPPA